MTGSISWALGSNKGLATGFAYAVDGHFALQGVPNELKKQIEDGFGAAIRAADRPNLAAAFEYLSSQGFVSSVNNILVYTAAPHSVVVTGDVVATKVEAPVEEPKAEEPKVEDETVSEPELVPQSDPADEQPEAPAEEPVKKKK